MIWQHCKSQQPRCLHSSLEREKSPRALALARSRVSSDNRPPLAHARTTRRISQTGPAALGTVFSSTLWLSPKKPHPLLHSRGAPFFRRKDTTVVSMASCARALPMVVLQHKQQTMIFEDGPRMQMEEPASWMEKLSLAGE